MMLAVAILLAFHLNQTILAAMLGVATFFILLTAIKIPRAAVAPQAVPTGGAGPQNEEILTPVVVTDTGETPYLYPPSFRMKIFPRWGGETLFEWASMGLGSALGMGTKMIRGDRIMPRESPMSRSKLEMAGYPGERAWRGQQWGPY